VGPACGTERDPRVLTRSVGPPAGYANATTQGRATASVARSDGEAHPAMARATMRLRRFKRVAPSRACNSPETAALAPPALLSARCDRKKAIDWLAPFSADQGGACGNALVPDHNSPLWCRRKILSPRSRAPSAPRSAERLGFRGATKIYSNPCTGQSAQLTQVARRPISAGDLPFLCQYDLSRATRLYSRTVCRIVKVSWAHLPIEKVLSGSLLSAGLRSNWVCA
jgi:hypothetical protein